MIRLVGRVVFGDDARVSEWVRQRIPAAQTGFSHPTGLGVVDADGVLIGGVVFHNYMGHVVEMSAAFDRPRWPRRDTLRTLFEVPFVQFGCAVMVTITGRKNKKARKTDLAVGFKLAGLIPKGWDGIEDAVLYAMTREECRWIKDKS